MKIKKIYIENFKGIKDKKIITFDDQSSLLIGPNGFGKTTIFDVLELCLTGELYRTDQKSDVTNDTKAYKKPFFQNTENQDVVVKVWLQNNQGKDFIIIKFLPADRSDDPRNIKNKPQDFDFFITYTENTSDFEKMFEKNEKNKITENAIEEFFELDKGVKYKDIYNLFNYLQQEESTFFLKKSEKDRKDGLDILFQDNCSKRKINRNKEKIE